MGKYFGTDGFRGEANKDLTVQHSFKVGRYLGYYYGKKNPEGKAKVVIGKDTRRSSYMFEYALVAGLTASGADVYLMHVTPTPSVSYIVRTDGFDCGIMISASHNPYYDNGIKIINGMGYKLEAAVEEEIERYIDGEIPEIPLATKENIGCTVDYSMGRNRYMGYLMTIPTRSFKNMRVGLDCANGAAYQVAKAVFDAVKEGDEVATEIATEMGEYLGHALANIAAVLDPAIFVIGGGVSKAGDVLLPFIEKPFKDRAFFASQNVKFALATLGNDAGICGAAKMVLGD